MSRQPGPVTDDEVDAFLAGFALRFDGYACAASRGRDALLAEWSTRFVRTLQLADDPLEDHAAFFALQRYLTKWGGEALSEQSREHLAYRLLFLHLYRTPAPAAFALGDGARHLRDLDLGRLEAVAARVREQLIALTLEHGERLRPGLGPTPRPGDAPDG